MTPLTEIDPPIVVILRAPDASRFVEVARALVDGGIRAVEFTFTSRGCAAAVEHAKRVLPGDVLVGCGTVRSVEHIDTAISAGADFAVSQVFQPAILQYATERGIPFVPGTLTPTEIAHAAHAGASLIKVSPIGPLGGAKYLRELTGPLPGINLLPTGGVNPSDARDYFEAGAKVLGVSSLLLGDALEADGDLQALATRTERLVRSLAADKAVSA